MVVQCGWVGLVDFEEDYDFVCGNKFYFEFSLEYVMVSLGGSCS